MNIRKYSCTSLLHRIYCAIFNKYPFIGNSGEAYYRDGSWEEFQKETLQSFRDAKIKSESPISLIASIASILSLVTGFVFYISPYNDDEYRLLTLPVLLILFGSVSFLSILTILIWNDKKNYCRYYEQLINNNHDILEKQLLEQKTNLTNKYELSLRLLFTCHSILSNKLHALAEEFRNLLFLVGQEVRDDSKCSDSFKGYLDLLCEITSLYFMEYSDQIGTLFIDKYSCCIKLIDEKQLYTNITTDKLRVKLLVRSNKPIDETYNKRLQEYAEKYDKGYDLINSNTDFNTILREKRWKFYLTNFLEEVAKKSYKTSHPDGHEYYKSAVSFPIIYRCPDKKPILLGFLCFDNYAPEAFPSCKENLKPDNTNNINIEKWDGFCCSQLDFLSIAIAKYLRLDMEKSINSALILGPFKKAK